MERERGRGGDIEMGGGVEWGHRKKVEIDLHLWLLKSCVQDARVRSRGLGIV